MSNQSRADLNSNQQQNFAASEYVVTVLENGAVVLEEMDEIELDFGYEAY